jgi:DNA-binding HxlR family transcriptional regulator
MRGYEKLIRLCHHRWAIPILAELHRARGSRFAAIANRLGINRDSLTKTLQDLILDGLVQRNPGYGHPLRPEYILTARGKRIGPTCWEIVQFLAKYRLQNVGFQKWSLPVLAALDDDHDRFAEIKSALNGITSRALTLTLKKLQSAGLIERTVIDDFPPTTRYTLTQKGHQLAILELKPH